MRIKMSKNKNKNHVAAKVKERFHAMPQIYGPNKLCSEHIIQDASHAIRKMFYVEKSVRLYKWKKH